ncbi:hypothetical protein SDC9_149569 [bioreactor metagenome]|uniref:Uncharacterized protein n=1 Tax=bioreactor metagenome TaxID=1076179 RepID=A0A645EP81_9ZZZZ
MRFSLRTMMSGARSSSNRLRRLLRLITRRYRSLRSLVAKRPPSSCTIGRISGGITGMTVRMIHSGLLPLEINASTTSRRLIAFARFWPEALSISSRSSFSSFGRSSWVSSSRMDSAPMPARNALEPYCSCASRYSLSVKICLYCSAVWPGSITT